MNIFEKIFFKSAPVYPAYERIYQHGEQHSAGHVISQGWKLGDYPLVKLDKPMPWHFNSEQERSWNFYLHCFDMIHPLLVQYDIDRSTDL